MNVDQLNLGTRESTNTAVDHIVLPPWSKNAPDVFISVMRQALESPIVTRSLPLWLDLIFGVKQTGEAAKSAFNVYQRMTYRSEVVKAITEASDPAERDAIVAHADNFGQTPRQVFQGAHIPFRFSAFSRVASILQFAVSENSRFAVSLCSRVQHIPSVLQLAFATEPAIVSFVTNRKSMTITACPARVVAVPDSQVALCWHKTESTIVRHALDTGRFISALKFESPMPGVELIECLYASRAESAVVVGTTSGVLYGVYPDAVLQSNVVGATLRFHTSPVAGIAVSEHLSRMITFTRTRTTKVVLPLDNSTVDLPMVWRLNKLFVSAMHTLDVATAFATTVKSLRLLSMTATAHQ
jgi:hypothetical protein